MTEHIRVLICDDDPLVRVALNHFIAQTSDITVVGEAEDGADAVALVDKLHPDVVVMDIQMPGMNGIVATSRITTRWPKICVLAVTTLDTRETVLPMLSAGASGYMLKDSSAEEITGAIRRAYEGESFLTTKVAAMLVQHVRDASNSKTTPGLEPLTARETEVLSHLAMGMSNTEMAKALFVSEGTIKAHLGSIISKWQVRDRVQVLVAAARAGLIDFK
jgi:DNA-binding NarL/FixJ family response regulator